METRKLVQSGLGSYVISVPKSWLDRHRMGKGDIIGIELQGNNLILAPFRKKSPRKERATFYTSESGYVLTLRLIKAYIEGYSEVLIKGQRTKEQEQMLEHQIETLAGYEVVEKQQEIILIQDLLKIEDISLKETLRKMDMTLRLMFQRAEEQLQKGITSVDLFLETDRLVNKLHFMILRIVRDILTNNVITKEFQDLYQILLIEERSLSMERLGDGIKMLIKKASQLSRLHQQKLVPAIKNIFRIYEELMHAHYTNNSDVAYQYVDVHQFQELENVFHKKEGIALSVTEKLKLLTHELVWLAKLIRYN